ncbi:S-layer homology domain-containing protein [Paenibacillus sp. GCM10027629]|uniref:S-layer homology domain-containing protein n=1 Tax=Paenibacillus sp. GCM10027629 TaxID=3273414 RepID=UPI00362708C4
MKFSKKIVLTTVAAGMVLSTFSGIPLSSKGLQEALGVSTAYAASTQFTKATLKVKLDEINAELAKGDLDKASVDKVIAALETPDKINKNVLEPVYSKNKAKLDAAGFTEDETVELFKNLALVSYGKAEQLESINFHKLLEKLKLLAGQDVKTQDVKDFAKELLNNGKISQIVLADSLSIAESLMVEAVKDTISKLNNNNFAIALQSLDLNVEDLKVVFSNFKTAVGEEDFKKATIAMAVATARTELTLKLTDLKMELAFKEGSFYAEKGNAILAQLPSQLIKWTVDGAEVANGQIPSDKRGKNVAVKAILDDSLLKGQAIYIGNVTVPSSETGGPGGIGNGSSIGGGAVVIDNVLPKFDDIFASFKTSKDALNVKFAAALAKLSTLNVSSLIVVENGKSVVSISDDKAAAYIKAIKEAYDKLVKQAKEFDPNFKAPALSITLDLGTTKTATAEVKLSKKLLELASEAQVSHIRVLVNGAVFSLPVAEFKGNVVVSITKENDSVATNVTKLPLASGVYSFSITVDGKAVEQFNNKVELQIPLLSATGVNEFLTIAKIVDGKLQILGGKLQGNSFKKSRNSLSSYVVVENKVSFNDVESVEAWAGKQIQVAAAKGIIEGKGEGNFDPRAKVTRAEFAKMLVKALELESTTAKNEFSDVADTSWAAEYVAAASSLGIINGVGNGKFDPNAEITRAQMAAMISRALKLTKTTVADDSVLNTFTDADAIPTSLKSDISVAVNEGLIIGSNGKFNPKGSATRAEAAVVIYRVVK